ncbi:unnamed protein product [Allacma fusca]|uniref:Uncharacterized protein n=1 Tax=Allacma fusca TaxID=39272 RepID=A0A8J2P8D8_9HEXA|nr:unnamed protein product [Allacma fusca]
MLQLPEHTPEKIKAEDIECNPSPAGIFSVSSLVATKYHGTMEKVVQFEENFQGKKKTQFLAAFAGKFPKEF